MHMQKKLSISVSQKSSTTDNYMNAKRWCNGWLEILQCRRYLGEMLDVEIWRSSEVNSLTI